EERFGEHAYGPLVEQAVDDAMKSAGINIGDVDHVVVTGLHTRAVNAAKKSIGARPDALVDDLTAVIGQTGTAHWTLLLCDVLDRAEPGQTIVTVHLADGCDVWVLRATDAIARRRPARAVRDSISAGTGELSYAQFL